MSTIKLPEKLTYFVGNANGRGLIRIEESDTGEHIASMPRGAKHEAFAAELVKRWNAHNALFESLAYWIEAAKNDQKYAAWLSKAQSALALAGKEGE